MKQSLRALSSFIILAFLAQGQAMAQLVVTPSNVANDLAQSLVGPGVTVNNAALTSYGNAVGFFSQTNTNLGIDSGIMLTSGDVANAVGQNSSPSSGTDNLGPGDADLTNLAGQNTFNAAVLEFDVTVSADSLKFEYVFGSEEYNDFVIGLYNDIFAFLITGPGIIGEQNIAIVPGTSDPVSIGNVNCGFNSSYYVCNDPWDPQGGYCTNQCPNNAASTTLEYDGLTVKLTAKVAVQACQTYHLKLAIADALDGVYDSGVFIKAGSLSSSSTAVDVTTNYVNPASGNPAIVEGCLDGAFDFNLTGNNPDTSYIYFTVGGTATNGVDYTQIPDSIQILPGDTTASVVIHSINDGVTEGFETVTLYLYLPCSADPYDSATIEIVDTLQAIAGPDTAICIGDTVQLTGNGADSWSWSPPAGLSCTTCQNPVASPSGTTTYTLTISLGGCTAQDQVTVTVDNPLPVVATPTDTICLGDSIQLHAVNGNSYSWSPSASLSCSTCADPWAQPDVTTTYIVDASNSCFNSSDTLTITVMQAADASAYVDTTVCPDQPVQLGASGGITYSWSPQSGLDDANSQFPVATTASSVTYTVLVTNQFGCTDTASATVNIFPVAAVTITPVDTVIYLGNSVQINATGAASYNWFPPTYLDNPTSSNPTSVMPQDTITYYLNTVSADGCVQVDSVTIYVIFDALVLVPSAFSPNNDGKNDNLHLLVRGVFNLNHLYIYNRWGQVVYETGNLDDATQNGWDGKLKGEDAPVGVYVYTVSGTDHNGASISLKGNITLVR